VIFTHLIQVASSLPSDSSALVKAIFALESSIKTLEDSSSCWERLAPWFTAAVVIGVVIEVVVDLLEHFKAVGEWEEDWHDWRRGLVPGPSKPTWTLLIWGIVGGVLVILGVAGELRVGIKIATINGLLRIKNEDLRVKNEQYIAMLYGNVRDAAADAASAQGSAIDAKNKADAVAIKAKELDRQLATVEAKRAKLEQSLTNLAICSAPRVINNWFSHGERGVDPLRSLAGSQALIEYVSEPEARRAAFHIAIALKGAGWIVEPPSPTNKNFDDGVMVKSYFSTTEPGFGDRRPSQKAADTVVNFLHSYFWQAKEMEEMSNENDVPQNGVKIEVGLYPAVTFVVPPGEKFFAEHMDVKNKIEEQRKQEDVDRLKRRSELLKNLPPKQQATLRSDWAHNDELRKSMLEPYEQPCRPLYDPTVHP
jgi:hypothetical protein